MTEILYCLGLMYKKFPYFDINFVKLLTININYYIIYISEGL